MILQERKITSRQATSSVLAEAEKVRRHLTIFFLKLKIFINIEMLFEY
jgi:hypothetical protein